MQRRSIGLWSASIPRALLVLVAVAGLLGGCGGADAGDVGADGTTPADATETLVADVPLDPGNEAAPLAAPCLEVSPKEVVFGGVLSGNWYAAAVELTNCGTASELSAPLTLTRLSWTDTTAECSGRLCLQPLPGRDAPVSAQHPLEIGVGETIIAGVAYTPPEGGSDVVAGEPVEDKATLLVRSNAADASILVPVSGYGLYEPGRECATAVIHVEEGEMVIPQTVLHLHGEASSSAPGTIALYEWTVEQPTLSTSRLLPGPSDASPTFEANVAGTYLFRLNVTDEVGVRSCIAAEAVVNVVPADGLHVELLWTSPGDPNPDDVGPMNGTDLDLHVAHPDASQADLDGDGINDPWFDPTWDTFWDNPKPVWNAQAYEHNPHLDREDVDGNGPESVNLDLPEDGLAYAIGVNYWDDHGFGSAMATVRVYVSGSLAYETYLILEKHNLWWVATITWPGGVVTPKLAPNEKPWITHDYHHPLFYQP